jgi:hypothetical protein
MHRTCLMIMRFCLSAWAGIAIFFVVAVIELRQSNLFGEETKFNHPKVLFPLYYGFEFSLLGAAAICAMVLVGSRELGRRRKVTLLGLVLGACALAVWDYGPIYRELMAMMESTPLPPAFHALHRLSRNFNGTILGLTVAAALVALWPTRPPAPPTAGASPDRA